MLSISLLVWCRELQDLCSTKPTEEEKERCWQVSKAQPKASHGHALSFIYRSTPHCNDYRVGFKKAGWWLQKPHQQQLPAMLCVLSGKRALPHDLPNTLTQKIIIQA
jgi:hypothetical protein